MKKADTFETAIVFNLLKKMSCYFKKKMHCVLPLTGTTLRYKIIAVVRNSFQVYSAYYR